MEKVVELPGVVVGLGMVATEKLDAFVPLILTRGVPVRLKF